MVFATFVAVSPSQADEILNHLSLGYDKLDGSIYSDPKAPTTKSLTANYGFNGVIGVKPYLGTGLAVTVQPDIKPGDNSKMNAGFAGKAGLLFQLDNNTSLNVDYKYLTISPETARGDNNSRPQSIGIGLDIKF